MCRNKGRGVFFVGSGVVVGGVVVVGSGFVVGLSCIFCNSISIG